MSTRSKASSVASSTVQTTPTDIEDAALAYEVAIDEEDIQIVGGRDGAEKSLAAMAKRDGLKGLIAAPIVTSEEGQPHNVAWCMVGIMQAPNETVFTDGRLKWSGKADMLFKKAEEGWYIRYDTEIFLNWRAENNTGLSVTGSRRTFAK